MTVASPSVLAMDAIFRADYQWLQRWLRGRTPNGQTPEDVAAETMLRMTRIMGREAVREPRAMMTVIAKRILYDLRLRGDLHRAYEEAILHLPTLMEPSPEEQLLVREALAHVDRILHKLSLKARSAFILSQIEGLRHAEIAEILGVSVSMVRKYIGQAMMSCYQDAFFNE